MFRAQCKVKLSKSNFSIQCDLNCNGEKSCTLFIVSQSFHICDCVMFSFRYS